MSLFVRHDFGVLNVESKEINIDTVLVNINILIIEGFNINFFMDVFKSSICIVFVIYSLHIYFLK